MTEDITSQILIQIRQDIAKVDSRVGSLEERLESGLADLRSEMRQGFAKVNEQLGAVVILMGHLARNDDRLEARIETIERHLGILGSV